MTDVEPTTRPTLGPFKADRFSVKDPAGRLIAYTGGTLVSIEEQLANAELFAAAPELLEALRCLVKVIDAAGPINLSRGVQLGPTVWFVKASEACDYALAVIAKAEGGGANL